MPQQQHTASDDGHLTASQTKAMFAALALVVVGGILLIISLAVQRMPNGFGVAVALTASAAISVIASLGLFYYVFRRPAAAQDVDPQPTDG